MTTNCDGDAIAPCLIVPMSGHTNLFYSHTHARLHTDTHAFRWTTRGIAFGGTWAICRSSPETSHICSSAPGWTYSLTYIFTSRSATDMCHCYSQTIVRCHNWFLTCTHWSKSDFLALLHLACFNTLLLLLLFAFKKSNLRMKMLNGKDPESPDA